MSDSARKIARRFAVHQLVHWAAVGVMVPVLTLVLRELGLTLFQVGMAMAAYSLTTVILEVPSGALADLWGRRKTYLLGTLSDILSTALFLSFNTLGVVLIASAVRGAGRAFASGSLEALAVESIRREEPNFDLQAFFSRVGMAIPAGLALTSLAGGFLPELIALPGLGGIAALSPAGGFSVNLILNALLIACAGILALTLFRAGPADAAAHESGAPHGLLALFKQIGRSFAFAFKSRDLILLLLSSFAIGLVLHSVETFWQPRLASITATETVRVFGVLGAGYFGVAVLGSALSPVLVRLTRGNRAAAVMLYRVLSAAALVGLALQVSASGFSVAYLGFFFLFSVTSPIQSTMLNERVADSTRSTLISSSSLVLQAGGFVGSLVFGVVSQELGIGVSWTVAGIALALSTLLYVPLAREHRVNRAEC